MFEMEPRQQFQPGQLYIKKFDRSGPYFSLQNWQVAPRDGGGSLVRVYDKLQKMMRMFNASYENAKAVRGDLANIEQKVDAHAISITHLQLQMAQLSSTKNPHQPGTLPSNTVQNGKNHRHCMSVITRGCKQTINPPMLSFIEDDMRREDEVVEASVEWQMKQ